MPVAQEGSPFQSQQDIRNHLASTSGLGIYIPPIPSSIYIPTDTNVFNDKYLNRADDPSTFGTNSDNVSSATSAQEVPASETSTQGSSSRKYGLTQRNLCEIHSDLKKAKEQGYSSNISARTGILHDLSAEEIHTVREDMLEALQQQEREHAGKRARKSALAGLFHGKERHEKETDELMRYFELEAAKGRWVAAAGEVVEVWRMVQGMGSDEARMAVRAAENEEVKAAWKVGECYEQCFGMVRRG